MSYITIRKEDEARAMKRLIEIGDGQYSDDSEAREDLHDLIKLATGHDEVLVG